MWSFAITLGLIQELLEAAGRYRDALIAARERVAMYRHLVTVRPDPHLSFLADALVDLARLLFLIGDLAQARAARAEADWIRQHA